MFSICCTSRSSCQSKPLRMIGEENKQKDLEQLKKFIIGPVVGFVSHLWYDTLRKRYPLPFLQLMNEYRNRNKGPGGISFDDEKIREARDRIHEANADLKAYILHPPEDEEERKHLERIVLMLEEQLLKQAREN
jgi:hypothetical protein